MEGGLKKIIALSACKYSGCRYRAFVQPRHRPILNFFHKYNLSGLISVLYIAPLVRHIPFLGEIKLKDSIKIVVLAFV